MMHTPGTPAPVPGYPDQGTRVPGSRTTITRLYSRHGVTPLFPLQQLHCRDKSESRNERP
eukprot:429763-Rhodomonas_salina.1